MSETGLYVYKPRSVSTESSRLHTIEDHNFWISRNGVCPYCRSGSRPVAKSLIVKRVESR